MTKADLAEVISKKTELTRKKAQEVVDVVIEAITEWLKKGEKLTLGGFGTFYVTKRKARKGRNPRTGAEVKIPATRVPKFSASKLLKEAIK